MSLIASGILESSVTKFDLRSIFEVIVPKFAFPDDSGDDDQNDDDNDQGGDGRDSDDGNDDGDQDQSGGAGDDIKDPEKKRLSDENAKWRRKARDNEAELEKMRKAQRVQDDKDKSDLEVAQRDIKETKAENERLTGVNARQARELAVYRSGAANQFQDIQDVDKFLDVSDMELDEEGNLDAKEVKDRIERILKEKPYLKRSGDDDGDSGGGNNQQQSSSGRPGNGKRQNKGTSREDLANKFPALRTRS